MKTLGPVVILLVIALGVLLVTGSREPSKEDQIAECHARAARYAKVHNYAEEFASYYERLHTEALELCVALERSPDDDR